MRDGGEAAGLVGGFFPEFGAGGEVSFWAGKEVQFPIEF